MPVPNLESQNIQHELQRKHEQLQQLIVQQQEELRRVSEQLIMAKYGLLPSMLNVSTSLLIEYGETFVKGQNRGHFFEGEKGTI
jgi:hypothetical protein